MTTIHISPELAEKLNRLAERERKTVDEMAEAILAKQVILLSLPDKPRPGSGAALLKSALAANINSGYSDTAERSREILNNDFPNYLWSRMHEDDSKE